MHKDYLTETETLDEIFAKTGSINALTKSFIATSPRANQTSINDLIGRGYYFEDSANIVFASADLFYRRNKITQHIDAAVDGGAFFIQEKGVNKYSGIRYGATLYYDNFSFRLGMNQYKDFSEVVPTLTYKNSYHGHNYTLEYTRQNALFYTYALCPYENRITANHFAATDDIALEDNTELWSSLEVNLYSNSDTEVTPQFDWQFYYGEITSEFTYHLALEGWYSFHSKPNDCYYSQDFYDSTLVRIDPQYKFSKYLGIKGKLGAGYSVQAQSFLYKYGLWAFGDPTDSFSYSAGCLRSNSARSIGSTTDYYYTECEANLEYRW